VTSTKMEDRIWRRMMAYSWVFFLSIVWGAFAFLYQVRTNRYRPSIHARGSYPFESGMSLPQAFSRDHELSRAMLYLMSFFTPLQVLEFGVRGFLSEERTY
jgi:hypothetical protein